MSFPTLGLDMLRPVPEGSPGTVEESNARRRTLTPVLVFRFAFAMVVMAVAVWLLRAGLPFGAVVVVVMAVWLRRKIEARSYLVSH